MILYDCLGMISIIVPIYNVEKYLTACIDSILASSYRDFELILVDDGSPDDCGRICDEYAAKDSRIKVIHQENQWVSAARNAGLKAATGEYIAFVDSDDVIHPRMLEVLHDAIISGEYDYSMVSGVIIQDKVPCYDDAGENRTVEFTSRRVVSQEEYMSNLANLGYSAYQYHVNGFGDVAVDWFIYRFSQLVVVMFLFYSGYGVGESFKRKGDGYVKSMPRHRILATLLNFDVAVIVFILLGLALGHPIDIAILDGLGGCR